MKMVRDDDDDNIKKYFEYITDSGIIENKKPKRLENSQLLRKT